MFLQDQWKVVLNKLENEVTAITFDLWINTLSPAKYSNDQLVLVAPTMNAKNQVVTQPGLFDKITKHVREEFTPSTFVRVVERDEYENELKHEEIEVEQEKSVTLAKSRFNKKYTFENFVVGKPNQVVYTAIQSVAEHPSEKFNPLFIYGGVGLGKTHLLHAVGNYLSEHHPEYNVIYVTCDNFMNDYISSVRDGKDGIKSEFRDKYRNADVLMVDDIQFIKNKTGTQEAFFNVFNDLYQDNKQIIIASDRPPKEIDNLGERLVTRLSSGLIQDVQEPDYETKIAIIRKKCAQEGFVLDEEVVDFIAQRTGSNVREIEGAITKVTFYSSLQGKARSTMEEAKEALRDYGEVESADLDAERIISTVCDFFKVDRDDLLGKKKNKEIVEPRQLCMYLIYDMLNIPLKAIGNLFGGKDHTTVINARDKIQKQIKVNPHTKTLVNDIKSRLLRY